MVGDSKYSCGELYLFISTDLVNIKSMDNLLLATCIVKVDRSCLNCSTSYVVLVGIFYFFYLTSSFKYDD